MGRDEKQAARGFDLVLCRLRWVEVVRGRTTMFAKESSCCDIEEIVMS